MAFNRRYDLTNVDSTNNGLPFLAGTFLDLALWSGDQVNQRNADTGWQIMRDYWIHSAIVLPPYIRAFQDALVYFRHCFNEERAILTRPWWIIVVQRVFHHSSWSISRPAWRWIDFTVRLTSSLSGSSLYLNLMVSNYSLIRNYLRSCTENSTVS